MALSLALQSLSSISTRHPPKCFRIQTPTLARSQFLSSASTIFSCSSSAAGYSFELPLLFTLAGRAESVVATAQRPEEDSPCFPVSYPAANRLGSETRRFDGEWPPARRRRRELATRPSAVGPDAEEAFKKTVEIDRLIDLLRHATPQELQKLVGENILAFNEGFWIRLAARTDTCKSEDDKKDYEELAVSVMSIVDRLVHQTNEKIESSTDVLKGILKPVVDEEEEIPWPPRDPEPLKTMEKQIIQNEREGQLDEGFLSEVNAQLRQAKEDKDKPGLVAMLQKVLQLYASTVLSKRSYAKKGNEVLKAEQFLESIIKAPEDEWNKLLIDGMTVGKGEVSPDELYAVIKKRIERTLIRTEGGSYQQRVLTEYLKGIQSRAEEIVQVLQGTPE